jgi:hypothetical protein
MLSSSERDGTFPLRRSLKRTTGWSQPHHQHVARLARGNKSQDFRIGSYENDVRIVTTFRVLDGVRLPRVRRKVYIGVPLPETDGLDPINPPSSCCNVPHHDDETRCAPSFDYGIGFGLSNGSPLYPCNEGTIDRMDFAPALQKYLWRSLAFDESSFSYSFIHIALHRQPRHPS